MGDFFRKILIVEYIVIAIVFLIQGNMAKAIYFLGVIILSVGILLK